MSGPPGPSAPKAIGSLAKKQSDVTRQGTQKLKFVPTLPQRRKKEEVKQESSTEPGAPSHTERGGLRGRGRGGQNARGRGRGRGAPPAAEMTASGPFALGPTQAASSGHKTLSQPNFISPPSGERLGSGSRSLSQSGPPSLQKPGGRSTTEKAKLEDEEVYSDPDEGIEIVDMAHVREMDWMAPESLLKERRQERRKVKKEEAMGDDNMEPVVNATQALDLSESEDDDEIDDILSTFMTAPAEEPESSLREDCLYCFQLPAPFPTFTSKHNAMDVDLIPENNEKRVTFAPDVKQDTSVLSRTPSTAPDARTAPAIEGRIGQLEFYRSGVVKLRLANDVLMDLTAATQPSFLQQAVFLDRQKNHLVVLGEVSKQFVATPNVDALLSCLEESEKTNNSIDDSNLIKMD